MISARKEEEIAQAITALQAAEQDIQSEIFNADIQFIDE
jgi:hypothetical protein